MLTCVISLAISCGLGLNAPCFHDVTLTGSLILETNLHYVGDFSSDARKNHAIGDYSRYIVSKDNCKLGGE